MLGQLALGFLQQRSFLPHIHNYSSPSSFYQFSSHQWLLPSIQELKAKLPIVVNRKDSTREVVSVA